MAATLASVCSVPLTSVLLLFELTKDYRILLPLMVNFGLKILRSRILTFLGSLSLTSGFRANIYYPYSCHECCNQGAVGLAIWVPSVANQCKEGEGSDMRSSSKGYSVLSPIDDKIDDWRQNGEDDLELCIMGPGDNHETIDEDIILEDLKVLDGFLYPCFSLL